MRFCRGNGRKKHGGKTRKDMQSAGGVYGRSDDYIARNFLCNIIKNSSGLIVSSKSSP